MTIDSEAAHRKRRPALAISGWMLLLCLFLPTLEVCGDPTMPVEFPPAYGVYFGAAAIAVLAGSKSLSVRRGAAVAIVTTWTLTATMLVTIAHDSLAVFLYGGVISIVGSVVLWFQRLRDVTVLAIGLVHAAMCTLWTLFLSACGSDALWGAYVSLAISAAMTIAGLLALIDEYDEQRTRTDAEAKPAPLAVARLL